MVARSSIKHSHMNIGASAPGKSLEEVVDQFCLQVTHQARADLGVYHSGRSSTEIHRGHSHGFVHRHQKVSGAEDAPLAAQCLIKRLPEDDSHILYRVMLVHVQIAAGVQLQIKPPVMREQFQHVVKEPDAGGHLIATAPLHRERNLNLRLFADPLDTSLPHCRDAPCAITSSSNVSWSALSNRSAWSRGPSVMRMHPSQP